MDYATERAWAEGVEEEVMAALFDVFDASARRISKTPPVPEGSGEQ
jgi:hypothetical protein